jgi:DNA-binding CsgD family transcriptional regulator
VLDAKSSVRTVFPPSATAINDTIAAVDSPRPSTDDLQIAALDEMDFGVLLVSDAQGTVVCSNAAARLTLGASHPLRVRDARLHSIDRRDTASLRSALTDVIERGLRRLVVLGCEPARAPIAIVPITMSCGPIAMVMLGRPRVADTLAIEAYGRSHQLTGAEVRVLRCLCEGMAPQEIASRSKLGLSTIRSQICSIRQKTGAATVLALIADIAVLPPFVGVLNRVRKVLC